jgi:DNA-binding LacI/PurR family transcriptional regulator
LSATRVILRDVAKAAGVHLSTASLAMKGDTRLRPETLARVQAAAQQMGYVADPALSALANYRREIRPAKITHALAYVTDRDPAQSPLNMVLLGACRGRAEKLGYSLEIFNVKAPGMSWRRLLAILKARGIRGVLLDPKLAPMDFPHAPGELCTVALTHLVRQEEMHRVLPHQFLNFGLHLKALRALGYRRIGLCLREDLDLRVGGNYHAAFMYWNVHHKEDAVSEVLWGEPRVEEVRAWVARNRVEVLVGGEGPCWHRLAYDEGMRFPEEVAFSALTHGASYWTKRHEFAGFCERLEDLGPTAVNHLVTQLDHRLQAARDPAVAVLVMGQYVPGPTAPGRVAERAASLPETSARVAPPKPQKPVARPPRKKSGAPTSV